MQRHNSLWLVALLDFFSCSVAALSDAHGLVHRRFENCDALPHHG